jgi:hypothetical protein
MTWSADRGYVGKGSFVFVTDPNVPCSLHFSTKFAGAITIDNISIRKWTSNKLAQRGLKFIDYDISSFKNRLNSLEERLSILLDGFGQGNSGLREYVVEKNINVRLKNLAVLMDNCKASIERKIYWNRELESLDADIFKLLTLKKYSEDMDLPKFVVVPETSLLKIRRDKPLDIKAFSKNVNIYAARNEYESFQLLVIPFFDLSGINVRFSDLKSEVGDTVISKEEFSWRKVEYVETVKKLYPVEYVGWWPDPLVKVRETDIEADLCVQPLWVTLYSTGDCGR